MSAPRLCWEQDAEGHHWGISGSARVAWIMRAADPSQAEPWDWAIRVVSDDRDDVEVAPTLEAARAAVEAAWVEWCASAGLGTVGWRTIETAPDGPLMLFSPGDGGNAPGGVVWVSGGWRYAFLSGGFRGDQLHGEPTHWRPLPGPPAEGAVP